MVHLSDVRYFLAVAQEENVSRAASRIGISQPALSHALRRLESRVGKRLLTRTKTGVHLTRAGQYFAHAARQWSDDWESLTRRMHESDAAVSGTYRIGCHPAVASYSLPKFMRKLQQEHPSLEIHLSHDLSREIVAGVLNWKIDLGLVINPPRHPELVIRELGRDGVTLWRSRKGAPADVLIYDPNLVQSQSILRMLERRKIRFARKMESTDLSVIRSLTASGCGVGILPERYAIRRISELAGLPALQKYAPDAPVFEDRLCLVYRVGAQTGMGAQAIIRAILEAKI